jgi:CheY-like chemotaxis protein
MGARRILIVEDEPAARDGLARLLAEDGYEVCTVGSGQAALARLVDFAPDTVLCDYYLADLTGLQVLRRARSLGNFPVTFILTTAGCGGVEMEALLRSEADHFLFKPLDLPALREILRGARPAAAQRGIVVDAGPGAR